MTGRRKTAFVFAGGGSLGAVQVGMLKTLVARGFEADAVVGCSVGAINAAYFAGDPTPAGVAKLEAIWRGLRRADVFPTPGLRGLMGLFSERTHFVESAVLGQLLERELPYRRLEEAKLPCVVLATDFLEGIEIRIASGPVREALLASAAIPGIFPAVQIDGRHLVDGGVANDTPIAAAVALGAERLIVLPTGYSCTRSTAPRTALGAALQGLNILTCGKLVTAVRHFRGQAEILVVPPLCPLDVSPLDFRRTGELLARAAAETERWLAEGVAMVDGVPHQLPPHSHRGDGNPYGPRLM